MVAQYKTVSPVGSRVFVKVDVSEAASSGGILLPTSAQKKATQGEVVSLGDAKSMKVRILHRKGQVLMCTVGTVSLIL